jgi:molybdopterin/thiamine biosynthesis adenylyltransferase
MLSDEKFFRNVRALGRRGQGKIRDSAFCIIGLGGTGGFALESLLRLGAENLILFDHDRVELGNFNRQLLAVDGTLDKRKTDAAASRARSINKNAKIRKFGRFSQAAAERLTDFDIVIDSTDSVAAKIGIAEACRGREIPYVFCSAEGTKGMVSVFTGYRFEKAFQVDDKKLGSKPCASVLCPAVALAGTLAAAQAVSQVLGKPVVNAPDALFFDIFDRRVFWRARLG